MSGRTIPKICETCGKDFLARQENAGRFCTKACTMTGVAAKSPYDRFIVKVNKTDSCWLWTGGKGDVGYGSFYSGTKAVHAHRWSYEYFLGPIPNGLLVCHKCDVRECVNPDHFFLGTHNDNTQDMIRKNRRRIPVFKPTAICKRGHTRSAENTKRDKHGRASCHLCYLVRYELKKEAKRHDR